MAKKQIYKSKPGSPLYWVGLWATIWWAVSGLYLVWLLWQSRLIYSDLSSQNISRSFMSDWLSAIRLTFDSSLMLRMLLVNIVTIWVVGALIWLITLKRQKVPFSLAFKDLFLTIRR